MATTSRDRAHDAVYVDLAQACAALTQMIAQLRAGEITRALDSLDHAWAREARAVDELRALYPEQLAARYCPGDVDVPF